MLVIVAVGALLLLRSVRVVRSQQAVVVERSGVYSRTLEAGRHFLVPFVDRAKPPIDLREQLLTFRHWADTKDDATVEAAVAVYFQVTEPRAASYETPNYFSAIAQLTKSELSRLIAGTEWESALAHSRLIGVELRGELNIAAAAWGIRVNRAELAEIKRN